MVSEELVKRLRKWAKSDLGLIVMYEAADTIEAQAAEIERWREAFAPGLNDDGTCDDHGQFGCRVCVSPRQARAALGETE